MFKNSLSNSCSLGLRVRTIYSPLRLYVGHHKETTTLKKIIDLKHLVNP